MTSCTRPSASGWASSSEAEDCTSLRTRRAAESRPAIGRPWGLGLDAVARPPTLAFCHTRLLTAFALPTAED
jgi:hypothetical protein